MALLENVVEPQRWNARAGLLTRSCRKRPSPQGDEGPDGLDQAERPSPLKEPVSGCPDEGARNQQSSEPAFAASCPNTLVGVGGRKKPVNGAN